MASFEIGFPGGSSFGVGGIGGGGQTHSKRPYNFAREEYSNKFQWQVDDARKAGLHPLFAMGQGASVSGLAPAGQADTGSHADIGIKMANAAAQKEISARTKNIELRNELLKIEAQNLRKAGGGNDIDPNKVVETLKQQPINPNLQERVKGEVVAHDPKSKQKGLGVRPLTNAITIGDQQIQFAVEEAADIAEDPVKIIGAAMLDRNNQGVQWRKAIRDYAGWAHPRDYRKRNLAERIITKELFGGLLKIKKHYKIPRYMGR